MAQHAQLLKGSNYKQLIFGMQHRVFGSSLFPELVQILIKLVSREENSLSVIDFLLAQLTFDKLARFVCQM